MTTRIEVEIEKLERDNDRGIGSEDGRVIALMVALNEICKALQSVAEGMRK